MTIKHVVVVDPQVYRRALTWEMCTCAAYIQLDKL